MSSAQARPALLWPLFINTGARALVPPIPGLADVDYMTNSDMMELDFLPEHLVIIGGSYVGLEFAQMFRRFGSRVTVIEKGTRLLAREDEDVSEAKAHLPIPLCKNYYKKEKRRISQ